MKRADLIRMGDLIAKYGANKAKRDRKLKAIDPGLEFAFEPGIGPTIRATTPSAQAKLQAAVEATIGKSPPVGEVVIGTKPPVPTFQGDDADFARIMPSAPGKLSELLALPRIAPLFFIKDWTK